MGPATAAINRVPKIIAASGRVILGEGSTATTVDPVPKISLTPGWGILDGFPSRAFELFFPGSPPAIDNVYSIVHADWIVSGVTLNSGWYSADVSIPGRIVSRSGFTLSGPKSTNLLLALALAL